jgi:hypothetical protein
VVTPAPEQKTPTLSLPTHAPDSAKLPTHAPGAEAAEGEGPTAEPAEEEQNDVEFATTPPTLPPSPVPKPEVAISPPTPEPTTLSATVVTPKPTVKPTAPPVKVVTAPPMETIAEPTALPVTVVTPVPTAESTNPPVKVERATPRPPELAPAPIPATPFADLSVQTPLPTPLPTYPAEEPLCSEKLDVILVLDGSTSVGADAFADMKEFLKHFVASFDLSGQSTEVGITHFSSADVFVNSMTGGVSEVVSPLTADRTTLIDSIDKMMYGGGRRYTAKALREAVGMMQPQRRPGVPAVWLVITDGFPSDMEDIYDASSGVRGDGRLMFSVVGIAGLAQQLSYVVSAPYENNIFIEEQYNDLLGKVSTYVGAVCSA